MDTKFIIKRGDLLRVLTLIAEDEIGPVDLDGVTAVFRMVNILTGAVLIEAGSATAAASVPFTAAGAVLTANGHPFNNGDKVTLKTTGALPGNLSTSQKYYVVNATPNTLGLATADGGTAIVTSSGGSGTNSLLSGRLTYAWQTGETNSAGTYHGEFITLKDGKPFSYPNADPLIVEILSPAEWGDRGVAIRAVRDRVQPEAAPKLTQGQVELETDRARCASVWQPNTFYPAGVEVVPPVRNGFAYVSCNPGTSGGSVSQTDWPRVYGESFLDGQSDTVLEWECAGSDRYNAGVAGAETILYDIGKAARQCWLIKARKASQMVDDGDLRFSQVYDNCADQASSFEPFTRPTRIVRSY